MMTVIEMKAHNVTGPGRESVNDGRLEWTSACPLSHLIPGLGVAVLIRGASRQPCSSWRTARSTQWGTSIRSGARR
ncbi:putative nitrite reductase small subunit [Rhodococcus sp. MTM3W5.2]|nr:putative nitrite reductase small subunit [Rhodococcus sp. MTM3W5.2]